MERRLVIAAPIDRESLDEPLLVNGVKNVACVVHEDGLESLTSLPRRIVLDASPR